MIGTTNLLLLVPICGAKDSQYSSNCVLLWDDKVLKDPLRISLTDAINNLSANSHMIVVPQPQLTASIQLKHLVVHKIETG